jgi:putative ABC transport system ATP-binding protein
LIELKDINKSFNQGRPNEFVAIRGITMSIVPHTVTVLKGPSGSGKTTLLTILGCMSRPTSGRIMLEKREVTSLPERFLTGIRRKTFGFIFQQFNLIKGLSALENVMVPAYPNGDKRSALQEKAMHLLELFNLAHKAEARVEWLSGGEAQRVTIARALINEPKVLIADEPTAHLDTRLSTEFMEIVGRLKKEGKTILIASHDPIVFECAIVDRIAGMRDGEMVGLEGGS